MNPLRSSSLRRAATHSRLASLLLSVTAASVLPLRAFVGGTVPGESSPPNYTDEVHVPQGCFISTVAYLARFRAEHPEEQGEPLTVSLRTFDGPHTIALITWRGTWWGRDEYSGVFALRCTVAERRPREFLRGRAETALGRLSAEQLKRGQISAVADAPRDLPEAERRAAVKAAAGALPLSSEVLWLRCGRRALPFLFFRPGAGQIAVYDPATGTASAVCASTDAATIVSAVAGRLGYEVTAVVAEPASLVLAGQAYASASGG